MNTLILGAGIIGTATAWYLRRLGHEVTVIDRQSDAAMETSFANAAQISVGFCEPWANRQAPWKVLKWMFDSQAPLLFRPQLNPQQWSWCLQFLGQCNDAAFARNVQQLVALGAYSHAALKDIVSSTGMEYHRLEKGIAYFYTDQKSFDDAAWSVEQLRRFGVERRVVSRDELLNIEPAFRAYGSHITGGTYTSTDESGDARLFTQQLAQRCAQNGVQFLYNHDVLRLNRVGNALESVTIRAQQSQQEQTLQADAIVVACGSYTAPLLRSVGVTLPIYPGKGYSATFPLLKPEGAPLVSTIDDSKKMAMTRLGNHLRVAGTIEIGDWNLSLDTPTARTRCHMLSRRIAEILPGVCDTRTPEEGGAPQFWSGLRPATPTNIPCIGRTPLERLWVNAGHGTLGWTHGAGSGKALAELISGQRPATDFRFMGMQ